MSYLQIKKNEFESNMKEFELKEKAKLQKEIIQRKAKVEVSRFKTILKGIEKHYISLKQKELDQRKKYSKLCYPEKNKSIKSVLLSFTQNSNSNKLISERKGKKDTFHLYSGGPEERKPKTNFVP